MSNKTTYLHVRMREEDKIALQSRADERKMSLSSYVMMCLFTFDETQETRDDIATLLTMKDTVEEAVGKAIRKYQDSQF